MRIIQIGDVVLDYGLWWREVDSAVAVTAEIEKTIDGALIVFEQPNRISAQNVTAESRDDGWQKKVTKDALVTLADNSMGVIIAIQLDNLSTFDVRFAYETKGGAVQFEPLYDGSSWYKGTIYMAKV